MESEDCKDWSTGVSCVSVMVVGNGIKGGNCSGGISWGFVVCEMKGICSVWVTRAIVVFGFLVFFFPMSQCPYKFCHFLLMMTLSCHPQGEFLGFLCQIRCLPLNSNCLRFCSCHLCLRNVRSFH